MNSDKALLATLDVLERLHRLPDTVALTTAETAVFLRSSVSALEAMRRDGSGPAYIQGGSKGKVGANQKCLYQKKDLLAWQEAHKIISSLEAAARKGQLFMTLSDLVQREAFWVDDRRQVVGMVEIAPVSVVIGRLGCYDIEWMEPIEAASRVWSDLLGHTAFAEQVSRVLTHQARRVQAGLEGTEISASVG